MSREKIAAGAFGCVLKPQINCTNKKDRTDYAYVSKVGLADHGDPKATKDAELEYKINKKLTQIDPDGMFFIYGKEMCQVLYKDLDKKTKALLDKCFTKRDKKRNTKEFKKVTDTLSNIILREGLDFLKIAGGLWEPTMVNVFKVLGHVCLATKTALDNNIGLMDIKENNLLFVTKDNKYIHPVHIDFSYDYIIDFKDLTLETYLEHWSRSHPTYNIWTPEARGIMMRNYYGKLSSSKRKTDKEILDVIQRDEKKRYESYSSSVKKIMEFYPWDHFYKNNDKQMEFDWEQSLSYLRRGNPKEVVEKMVIWKIGEALTRSFLDKMSKIVDANDNSDPRIIYMKLLLKMKHPNILKRLDFDSVLSYIDYVLGITSKRKDRYLIEMDEDILMNIMQDNDYFFKK